MSQPKLFSIIDKAIFDYKMIEPGDRILIGASGGKDSTALVEYFSNRAKRKDANFTFTAIHIETDFEACTMNPRLRQQLKDWNVDTLNYFVDVENRVIEISVIPNRELESLILSYGKDVQVLEPESFRHQIAEVVRESLLHYFPVQIDCTDAEYLCTVKQS